MTGMGFAPVGEGMDIVALDDNHHTLSLVRSVLRSLGYDRIRCYLKPESALAAIEAAPPQLVITDWELGPISGVQFVRSLRASRNPDVARLPIIMLTAHSEDVLVRAARDAGIDSFLIKPFSARSLSQHVEAVRSRTRAFIQEDSYVGPDRRHMPPGPGQPLRRAADPLPPSGDTAFDQAEDQIAALRRRFEMSLASVIAELEAAAEALGRDERALARCRRLAHDLRGQGATFGYPLLSEFAGSLTRLLAKGREGDPLLGQLVGLHVKAIAAVAHGRITGDGGDVGRALREGFERTIARVTGGA